MVQVNAGWSRLKYPNGAVIGRHIIWSVLNMRLGRDALRSMCRASPMPDMVQLSFKLRPTNSLHELYFFKKIFLRSLSTVVVVVICNL